MCIGRITKVLIDDWIPLLADGVTPAFGRSNHANELWVSLIEKAYAKLHRSYQAIEGGWVDAALVDLTGGSGERYAWADPAIAAQVRSGAMWTTIVTFHQSKYLMGCGSPGGASDREEDASAYGIVQSHAYSILQAVEVDGIKLLQIRNPW
jgi:hypothetical protein